MPPRVLQERVHHRRRLAHALVGEAAASSLAAALAEDEHQMVQLQAMLAKFSREGGAVEHRIAAAQARMLAHLPHLAPGQPLLGLEG